MKLQKLSTLTTFIVLINVLSAHGMEPNNNDMHPLLSLPLEIQHQIIFPQYTQSTEITRDKMNELKEVVKTFFIFNIVSKDFNQRFKLPWSNLELAKKNEMLEGIIDYMTVLPYARYRTVPLVLIYSGADADAKPKSLRTCLAKAVGEGNESAIAMLLKHGANPYQTDDQYGKPICFCASTVAIAELFLKKIDKDELLSKSSCTGDLLGSRYSLEMMTFWFDYGVNPRKIYSGSDNDCLFHCFVRSLNWYGNTGENIVAKGELLLKRIPDMLNTINGRGETPLDMAIREDSYNSCYIRGAHKCLIALFREHGGKTAKELAAENIQ